MTIDELKAKIQRQRADGAKNSGKAILCSETGPAGFGLIEDLVAIAGKQQDEIARLRADLDNLTLRLRMDQ